MKASWLVCSYFTQKQRTDPHNSCETEKDADWESNLNIPSIIQVELNLQHLKLNSANNYILQQRRRKVNVSSEIKFIINKKMQCFSCENPSHRSGGP